MVGRLQRKRITDEEIEKIRGFNPYSLLPWVLMIYSPLHPVLQGQYPHPIAAYVGLGIFAVLYCAAIVTSFRPRFHSGRLPLALALLLVPVTGALAGSLDHGLILYSLLIIICAVVVPDRFGPLVLIGVPALAALTAYMRGSGSSAGNAVWTTVLPGGIVFVMSKLFTVVAQLKETRQELARAAVAEERLRFSRDLHDLLGHTMSVVALKAEAVRRLAPANLDAALAQAEDIEQVSRKALAEIREAVSGYRDTGLAEEMDRARSLLNAARIEPVVKDSGPTLPAQAEGLLAWVVREGVTNVVRHGNGVRHCEIELDRAAEPVRLSISDDGAGSPVGVDAGRVDGGTGSAGAVATGNGLRGLRERLSAAGGTLTTEATERGFRLLATLPTQQWGLDHPKNQGRGGNGSGAPITA
ncbi:sensor histidine kinase [Streptacidiphilus sp. EB129]|uniref:sensor histidine kinase n=1 Tax=Streptacidiphilus sp. EB129 TaxID=3156262 RepID=UPI00351145E6